MVMRGETDTGTGKKNDQPTGLVTGRDTATMVRVAEALGKTRKYDAIFYLEA